VPLATHSITPNNEIVLNVTSADDVIDVIKSELEEEEEVEGVDAADGPTLIIPWPAFVPVASHPELAAGQRRKRKTASPAAAPSVSGADKRARSRLEDVTDQYGEEDTEENQVCK